MTETGSRLVCPLDGLPLVTIGQTARCTSGHSFDWSRDHYLNLLPVHAKQSKDPGDSIAMVQARQRFLAHGFYDPVIAAIGAILSAYARGQANVAVLDAGCGEGYYLNRLQARYPVTCYGLDISKHAVKAAAKLNRAVTWLVASNKQLPFAPHSIDVIICAFGFPVWPEFQRVLKQGGLVIMADPGTRHLIELRRLLYGAIKSKDAAVPTPGGFQPVAEQAVAATFHPDAGALRDLIAMTPHQHRAAPAAIDKTIADGCPDVTLDVMLRVFQS